MLKRYFLISIKDIWKVKSIKVLLILYLFSQVVSSIAISISESETKFDSFFGFNTYSYFNTIFISLITLVLSLFVFKGTKKYGYETILRLNVSYKRIYLSKLFLVTLLISSIILVGFLIELPFFIINFAISSDKFFMWFFSRIIGTLFTQFLIISLAFLMSIYFSRITSLIIFTLLIVVTPLISSVVQNYENASPENVSQIDNQLYSYDYENSKLIDNNSIYSTTNTDIIYDINNHIKDRNYKVFSYFDFWYQSNILKNLVSDKNTYNKNDVLEWGISNPTELHFDFSTPAGPNGETISMALSKNDYLYDKVSGERIDFRQEVDKTISNFDSFMNKFGNKIETNMNQTWIESFNSANLVRRIALMQWFIRGVDRTSDANREAMVKIFLDPRKDRISALNSIEPIAGASYFKYASMKNLIEPSYVGDWFTNSSAVVNFFIINGQMSQIIEAKPYLEWYAILSIWMPLIILFNLISVKGYKWIQK